MPDPTHRKQFRLFATIEEELAATPAFWRSRTPHERLEYLLHLQTMMYGEVAMNAPMVRCYGWRKFGEEPDPSNTICF